MKDSSQQKEIKKRELTKFFNETSNFINKLASYLASISKASAEDLKQEGFLGVYRASKSYDKARASFFTYAQYWIRAYMYSTAFKSGGFMHVPSRFYCIYSKYKKLCDAQDLHTSPKRYKIIAELLDINESYLIKVVDTVELIKNAYSMDEYPDLATTSENCVDYADCSSIFYSEQLLDQLKKIVTPKEYFVLNHVLGLETPVKRTLLWIGKILGVTKERVRQIKCSALNKVKKYYEDQKTLAKGTEEQNV